MRKTVLHSFWAAGLILCACLGFIQQRSAGVQGLLTALSLLFFLPPALLLFFAAREGDKKEILLLFRLSLLSLGLTLLGLVLAIATAAGGKTLVTLANAALALVSAPMYCANSWVLSLFCWACLLCAGMKLRK